ncbi:NfeD family protein [Bartonella sp. DGB2]|uniref:NfeD family protein n=1 Tax=Bartonella sp. DGB2 TaxID=3388426 RepID=UPI0039903985
MEYLIESPQISFGVWGLIIFGFSLLVVEIFISGIFLMWLGAAALLTALVFALWEQFFSPMNWQVQVLIFLVFSWITIYSVRRYVLSRKGSKGDLLNNRVEEMLGTTTILVEDLKRGRGRILVNDVLWTVVGPDLPKDTFVTLVHYEDGYFRVEPAESSQDLTLCDLASSDKELV